MPAPKKSTPEEAALSAQKSLLRKSSKTPLEDALASKGGLRLVRLVQFARTQFEDYWGNLATWRQNRILYAQEAADVFKHREENRDQGTDAPRLIFNISNESLNFVAGLCEFATAQAEQDLYGGSPWFAAIPVGRNDEKLADVIQKHLQYSFRDGRLVESYCSAITLAGCLGEAFTKTTYEIETDHYEQELKVLHADGKPVMQGEEEQDYITTAEEAEALKPKLRGKKLAWKPIYLTKEEIVRHGIRTTTLHHNDVAFREDAPSLDLECTNFYSYVEMSVLEAKQKFNLSIEDARKLAVDANISSTTSKANHDRPQTADSPSPASIGRETPYGEGDDEWHMNVRVRLVEGYMRVDPFGDGKPRRIYVVFTPQGDDEFVFADYLGNISPKSELPVKCHVWEEVPNRLYGRGFFGKYGAVQRRIDDTWNQVSYRNRMHSNPIGGFHPERLERDDDDGDLCLKPGDMLRLKGDWKLEDVLQFMQMPDLDQRSMELLQVGMQMAQTRSGITTAAQGDLSAVPENNTATGIRSLMSRAAVLMKKPVRKLRLTLGRDFAYAVKLFYANFNRDEAFVWGEGEVAELLELSADQVNDLDIDIRMLLTQEQNQTKLEGAQVAAGLFSQWMGIPEIEKTNARPLFLQAMKALEFEGAEEIIRTAAPTLEDALQILPQDQQQRGEMLLQMEQQAAQQPLPAGAVPAEQQTPPQPTPQQTPAP